jgi:7-keto-8-aminopelargonate synthetase-like enzyme
MSCCWILFATGKGTQKQRRYGTCRYITGTLGEALGGAMGGYTTAKKKLSKYCITFRPYCFNSSAPTIVGTLYKSI